VRTYRKCGIDTIVLVVGSQAGRVIETVGKEFPDLLFAYQREQRGTGDAARVGFAPLERMQFGGPVIITAGDKLVEPAAVTRLKTEFYKGAADCAFLVSRRVEGSDQGRVAVGKGGRVQGIFEAADINLAKLYCAAQEMASRGRTIDAQRLRELCLSFVSSPEKLAKRASDLWSLVEQGGRIRAGKIVSAIPGGATTIDVGGQPTSPDVLDSKCKLCNESFYIFSPDALKEGLLRLTKRPGRDEEYLTDVVNILSNPTLHRVKRDTVVRPVESEAREHVQGFNTPDQLMAIEQQAAKERPRKEPRARPSVPLGRRSFREVSEWIGLFTRMPPRFRAMLKDIYGEADEVLKERKASYLKALRLFARKYGRDTKAIIVRAPGSVNLMGRHVDNRGGHVNLMNIGREVLMVAAPRDDDLFCLSNVDQQSFPDARFSLREEVSQLDWDDWLSYVRSSHVRRMVLDSKGDWSNYVRAAVLRLQQHFHHVPLRGMNCAVHANIPIAAGLGSSVAQLVAASDACIALNGLSVSPQAFIDLCGEGEWYVSGGGQGSARVGMKIGGRDQITAVSYLPFEIQRSIPFPDGYRLAICHCAIPGARSRQIAGLKRQQMATFDLALLFIKDRFPLYAHLLDHLRDLNTRRLGISQRDLYSMLLALPLQIAPADLAKMLSSAHRGRFEEISESHEPPRFYDLRSATLFSIAECARAEAFTELVRGQRFGELGALMACSHDAERVASLVGGKRAPYSWRATDEYVNSLISDLGSEDPERVGRAQIHMQPGRYGCGAAEIDEMVDIATGVKGVVGAQLSGVGIAGCMMVLLETAAVASLRRTLKAKFYARRKERPDITLCTPVASADVLGA